MQLLPSQPSSIAKILDASFKLYTACFTRVIGFGLIISALYIVVTILSASFVGDLPVPNDADAELAVMLQTLPVMMGYVMAVSVLSFIFYAGIIYRIDNVAQQREDSFGEAFLVGLKKFPSMLLATILYSIAVSIGSLLLLVPGIILMLSLAFYPLLIVVENLGGYASLKASHHLVWGNWWRTLTVYMAPGILALIVYAGLGLASYPLGGNANDPTSVDAMDIVSNLWSALVMPYFYALAYVLYHDLKLRKTGSDLAARLSN